MPKVQIAYPDGRRFQTTEAGFKANHEPFGAEIVAYVGIDGRAHPADADGKREAAKASDPNETPITRQTATLQADAAKAAGEQEPDTPSPDDGNDAKEAATPKKAKREP